VSSRQPFCDLEHDVSDGAFYGYILLLLISGVLLVVMAVKGFGQSVGMRLFDAAFGAGFLVYAGYLLIGQPESVRLLLYAFIVPIVAIGKAYRARQAHLDATVPQKPAPKEAPSYAYAAPVLTARVGQPPPASPYGRNVPGQPVGPAAAPTGASPLAGTGKTDTMSPDQASPQQPGTE
jgi:hypothetical protein